MSSDTPGLPNDVESLEQLLHFADRFRTGQYLAVASFVFLLYDYLLTFPDEVEYIWKTRPRITIAKCLFYIIRYFSPCICLIRMVVTIAPTPSLCQHGIAFSAYGAVANVACVEIVLMLRVWALYGKSRIVTILLATVFLLGVATSILVVRFVGTNGVGRFDFLALAAPPSVTGCINHSSSTQYFFLFMIGACVECLAFTLTAGKAMSQSRGGHTPMVTALLKHGTVYFGVVFFIMLFTILSFLSNFLAQAFMSSNVAVSITASASARLILSLRGLYAQPVYTSFLRSGTSATLDWAPAHGTSIPLEAVKKQNTKSQQSTRLSGVRRFFSPSMDSESTLANKSAGSHGKSLDKTFLENIEDTEAETDRSHHDMAGQRVDQSPGDVERG